MAVLRELIASVVFRWDAKTVKTAMADVDRLATGLKTADRTASKGVALKADTGQLGRFLSGMQDVGQAIRHAGEQAGMFASKATSDFGRVRQVASELNGLFRGVKGDIDTAGFDALGNAMTRAGEQARIIRDEMARLAKTDPQNPRLLELQGHLDALRMRTRQVTERFTALGQVPLEYSIQGLEQANKRAEALRRTFATPTLPRRSRSAERGGCSRFRREDIASPRCSRLRYCSRSPTP